MCILLSIYNYLNNLLLQFSTPGTVSDVYAAKFICQCNGGRVHISIYKSKENGNVNLQNKT